jgi:hypothetical protein
MSYKHAEEDSVRLCKENRRLTASNGRKAKISRVLVVNATDLI